MDLINHPSAPNGRFVAKDPNIPGSGTALIAEWHNDIQYEIINAIKGAGLTPNRSDLQQLLAAIQALISKSEAQAYIDSPVTPNLLADTYQFSTLCGGAVNTAMNAQDAHANSIWSAYLSYGGSVVNTTMTVITLDKLKDFGLHPKTGDDFSLANPDYDNPTYPFHGGNFRVVLFDINAVSGTRGAGYLHQGCYKKTGWGGGPRKTIYASALVNVLECTSDIKYDIHGNMCEGAVVIDASDVGKGWQYKYGLRTDFGGCHQPWTGGSNLGRIRFALALPYIGFGRHGSQFIWTDAIAKPSEIKAGTHSNYRYSHWMGN